MANLVANKTEQVTEGRDKPSSSVRFDRAERLKELRKMTRLSRQKFAKRHKLPYGSLQNWEDCKYGGLTKTGAPRVIAALREEGIFVSLKWLLEGTGPLPYVSAPILLKRMQIRNTPIDATSSQTEEQMRAEEQIRIEEELNLFRHHYKDILNTTMPDHAMTPAIQENDCVAGKKYPANTLERLVGKICIVTTENKEQMVRKLEKGSKPGHYNLVCTNPSAKSRTQENVKVLSAAPVTWIRRKTTSTT